MTIAGIVAITLALAAALAMAPDGRVRAYYFLLFAVHLAAAFAFWAITLTVRSDPHLYYRHAEWTHDIGLGTAFISYLTGLLRRGLDISYLDGFLFFQIPGLIGIILLHKAATRLAAEEFGTRVAMLVLVLLMPGLQFWTASIGKDSLAILGYGLIALALTYRPLQWLPLAAGVLIYFMIRPHIAFILVLSMALAFLPVFGRSSPRAIIAGTGAVLAFMLMLPFIFYFVGIEEAGVAGVTDFISRRQALGFRGGSGFDLSELTAVERIFTIWFRPLFFDADGANAIVASVENLFLIGVFAFLIYNGRLLLRLFSVSEVLRFHGFFLLFFTLILSQTTGNLGLALRQKMMAVPALILIFVAVAAYLNRLREERRDEVAGAIAERMEARAAEAGPGG
ncbi:hypothetical protein KHP62_01240 [Rhodobacteraceae bacterium NNCM2]|nr:hypothetical protein [Coraliihabitans acroporae]